MLMDHYEDPGSKQSLEGCGTGCSSSCIKDCKQCRLMTLKPHLDATELCDLAHGCLLGNALHFPPSLLEGWVICMLLQALHMPTGL